VPSASTTPRTTRAARLHQHGEPLVIETVELPAPDGDQILVELEFAGVNPIDGYIAEGRVAPDAPLPRTLGGEASGTAAGRPVVVAGEGLGSVRDGVWAEAAVVPAAAVLELPDGVELRSAAAMGIAGLTAWNVVRDLGQVRAEDRVLVLGASGGVGSLIVSLVHAAGATVWGQTGSEAKSSLISEQGADRVIVSGPEGLTQAVSELKPTIVFDPLGGEYVAPVVEAIEPRGRLVSFGTSAGAEVTFNLQTVYRKMASLLGYGGMQLRREERRAGLEAALEAVRDGRLRVPIDEVLPLERVGEAFERLGERKVQGNLVLVLRH
jgi:NADPH2:quinone reductase